MSDVYELNTSWIDALMRGGEKPMILILTKTKHDNKIDCAVTVAAEGVHTVGTLHFPNQITWTRFLGALQRGSVGMRDLEVRLDVAEAPLSKEEEVDEAGSVSK